jgi:hypothetical protein
MTGEDILPAVWGRTFPSVAFVAVRLVKYAVTAVRSVEKKFVEVALNRVVFVANKFVEVLLVNIMLAIDT